jgi:eukaryotic-like serine/threonine-protein kinase
MRHERVFLEEVVESLADGVDIDWDALEERLRIDGGDRRVLEQLKVLARIAEVHRSHANEPDEEPPLVRTRVGKVIPMPGFQGPGFQGPGAQGAGGLANQGPPAPDGDNPEPPIAAAQGTVAEPVRESPRPVWGHLELYERIGEGTFGEVYRARDTRLEREVAVKLLRVDDASTNQQTRRILREARSLARVQHDNVVAVHGAETHDGRVGLWMQLIRGATLEQLLRAHGPFSAREAALIGQDLCSAVSAVHNAGLVHRDIKTQNVMREEGGRTVLMDFGAGQLAAPDANADWQRDRLTGTPLYLAPEVLAGGEATARSDIYSIGVLLYHLVTNAYPAKATSLQELREAHAQNRRISLRDARPGLGVGLVQVIEKAIEPDAAHRYQTAGEMRAALDHVLNVPEPREDRARQVSIRPQPLVAGLQGTRAVRALPYITGVAIAAILIAAALAWQAFRPTPTVAPVQPRVIAVLDLAAGNGVNAEEALGVTESLHDLLSTIDTLRVVSRRSVQVVSKSDLPSPELAGKLNADTLIEGRLEQADRAYRLSLRLIRAGSGSDQSVTLGHFDAPLARRQTLLYPAAAAVARALDVRLPPSADRRSRSAEELANDAHDRYTRARYYLNTVAHRGHPDVAVKLFDEAIEAAPAYGEAYAGLSRARFYLALSSQADMWPQLQQAREAAVHAISLDPTLAEAHAVLGIANFYEWKWTEAEEAFKQAVALNPSNEFAAERYAAFLAARGRVNEGLAHLVQVRRIDPLSPLVACATATMLHYAGRFDEALQEVQRSRSLDPSDPASFFVQGRILAAMGRYDEAIVSFRQTLNSSGGRSIPLSEIAAAEAAAGRPEEARKLLAELESPSADPRALSELVAFVYGQLGDFDSAFARLDKALDARPPRLLWLKVDPRAKPLRSDPRFAALLARLELRP